jgi:LuxR family maltose regulon positive regulatory protein
LALLEECAARPLTIVIAPAGTGKSALAASWATETEVATAWYAVDNTDHDASQFWTGVITALASLFPTALPAAMGMLQRPGPAEHAIAALLQELEGQRLANAALVIDDVHIVDSDPATVASLDAFVQHLPEWLHVVLVGRRVPALPLARMRVAGRLGEIGVDDLLFSHDEAAELFVSLAGPLDFDWVDAEISRTGGWAAAIRLAAMAVRSGQSTPEYAERQQGLLISEYLWDEMLAGESPELVDALLDISVVERINASLAEYLTDLPRADQILSTALSRGLFVTRLDNADWYEINALVREQLRAELWRRSSDRAISRHSRAARWLSDAGDVAGALEQWLAAHRPDEALRLLAHQTIQLYDTGREASIARAIARLPPSIANDDLEQAINLAWCYLLVDRRKFVQAVDQATAFEPPAGHIDTRLRSQLDILRSMSATTSGDLPAAGRFARAGMEDLRSEWLGDLLGPSGWNMMARIIALSEEWSTSPQTRAIQLEMGRDPQRRLGFEGVHALGEALAGHPIDALRIAAGVREAAAVANMTILSLELATAEAIAHRELGDDTRALTELEAVTSADLGPATYAGVLGLLELTQVHLDAGRYGPANLVFDQAITLVENEFHGPAGRSWLGRTGTRLALANQDIAAAAGWAESIVDPFWGPLSRARIDIAASDLASAGAHVQEAEPRCDRHTVMRDLVRARTLTDRDEVADVVSNALVLASTRGLIQTVASEGADCMRLVEMSAWAVPDAWMDHVRRAHMGIRVEQPRARSFEVLTDRELEVLRLLPSRLTLQEIADELFISMNTLKFHLKVIYRKLGCRSRSDAAALAQELTRPVAPGQRAAGSGRTAIHPLRGGAAPSTPLDHRRMGRGPAVR